MKNPFRRQPTPQPTPMPTPTPTKPADYTDTIKKVKAAVVEQGGKTGSVSVELPEGANVAALKVKLSAEILGWRGGSRRDPEGRENWIAFWWNIDTTVEPHNHSGTIAWAPELKPRYLEVVHDAAELRESALGAVVACAADNYRAKFISLMASFELNLDANNTQLAADVASFDPRLAGMRWRIHRSADAMDLLVVDRQEAESPEDRPRHHPV